MFIRALIWDNDGTISGSKDPNDRSSYAKVILPNVVQAMSIPGIINVICSGIKTSESEKQDFDPAIVINKLTTLMNDLPVKLATFSPKIGGIEGYALIKHSHDYVEIKKLHEEARYAQHLGEFKKPGVGMLVAIKDILAENFNLSVTQVEVVFIGDSWHDKEAANHMNIQFVEATSIHNLPSTTDFSNTLFLNELMV